jgi:hypothetical protein
VDQAARGHNEGGRWIQLPKDLVRGRGIWLPEHIVSVVGGRWVWPPGHVEVWRCVELAGRSHRQMRSRSGLYVVIQRAVPDLAPCLYMILQPTISHLSALQRFDVPSAEAVLIPKRKWSGGGKYRVVSDGITLPPPSCI